MTPRMSTLISFSARSSSTASFDELIASLPAEVQVEALRTVIVLSARTNFSFVAAQARRLLVGVFLERPLDSPRVVKIDHISDRKVGSVVNITRPERCRW